VLLDFFSGVLQGSRPIFHAGSASWIVNSLPYSRQVQGLKPLSARLRRRALQKQDKPRTI